MLRAIVFLSLGTLLVGNGAYDDFHYPQEESTERANLVIPEVISIHDGWCVLSIGSQTEGAAVGMEVFHGWQVVAILNGSLQTVILEWAFSRWGLLAFLAPSRPPLTLRKSLGRLADIRQPFFNFTGTDPHYFDRAKEASSDILAEQAMHQKSDGELDYSSTAALLAPARDIVEISSAADVVKFVVTHAGRVKCASSFINKNSTSVENGIVERTDLHAPPPNHQTVVFDPADHLSYWPRYFEHSKTGLIGGHLPVANVGSYSHDVSKGFELIAFSPVTQQPGINYSPGVYIRLREQSANSHGHFKYFYATNYSLTPSAPADFYSHLQRLHDFYDRALSDTMRVSLPEVDRRQLDMSFSSLLTASGNYVGDQANYGNGATYWSVGRQDNGSLPLNILAVDGALLEWGMCGMALQHIGFWFDNYVEADGTINYYTWGRDGIMDSLGDIGRLASLYVRAVQLCQDADWAALYLPVAKHLGEYMLRLRLAPQPQPPETCCHGLVKGAPEADWSWGPRGVRNESFYSNNVWLLRGMQELGVFLQTVEKTADNQRLSALLLDDAHYFHKDILTSVEACTVYDEQGKPQFTPPFARIGFQPFANMTQDRTASYSNFRFYSEALLADVLPRDIETMLLKWHSDRGGRLGGASRLMDWLDDMPSAGWGYAALTNNRTTDFLALLYGHMANFQSRGSFHSTEQLSFRGQGWYRDFLSVDHFMNGNVTSEVDVDFCIVSQVLVARLTKWQLVLEDFFRNKGPESIWLARGAPKRWFGVGAGFSVTNAPTRVGRISYKVTIPSVSSISYHVWFPGKAADLIWHLRLPGNIRDSTCSGCAIRGIDANGFVSVSSVQGASSFGLIVNLEPATFV